LIKGEREINYLPKNQTRYGKLARIANTLLKFKKPLTEILIVFFLSFGKFENYLTSWQPKRQSPIESL
jgi:hypothetical protein